MGRSSNHVLQAMIAIRRIGQRPVLVDDAQRRVRVGGRIQETVEARALGADAAADLTRAPHHVPRAPAAILHDEAVARRGRAAAALQVPLLLPLE